MSEQVNANATEAIALLIISFEKQLDLLRSTADACLSMGSTLVHIAEEIQGLDPAGRDLITAITGGVEELRELQRRMEGGKNGRRQ